MARSIILRFIGDSSSLDRTFSKVNTEGSKLGTGLKKGLGIAGLSMATAGIAAGAFAKDSINAFREAQAAQSRLADAFSRFPALSDTNQKALGRLNTQLARKTKFDDDATASGQAVLAGFKLTGSQITTLTPLLLDYAAKTGKDLPTAARDLGKAMGGQGRALKAIGIDFKATGDTTRDFASLTDVLRSKVGGFAEREGKTAAGRAEILKNQMGELQEKIGSLLVPALGKLTDGLLVVNDWFNNLSPTGKTLVEIVAGLAAAFVVVTGAVKAFTAVQAALDVVLAANPVVLITLALVALGAALVVAYQKSETFRNVVNAAFAVVKGEVDLVIGAVKTLVDWFKKAWEWAGKVVDKLSHVPGSGVAKSILHAAGIPGFAEGGVVPGPVGAAQLAVVHGGERVLTPSQQRGGARSVTYNIYSNDPQTVINAIQAYERRNGKGWRNA